MPPFTPELIAQFAKNVLPKIGHRVEPFMKFVEEKGLPKEMYTLAEQTAQKVAVDGLRQGGAGRTNAFLRVYLERAIDKGMLPQEASPLPGVFNITTPHLAAKLTDRIMGRVPLKYNPGEGKSMLNPAYVLEHIFGSSSNPALDTAAAAASHVQNSHYFLKSLRPLVKHMDNPRRSKEFAKDMTEGYRQVFPLMGKVEELAKEARTLRTAGPRTQLVLKGQTAPADRLTQVNQELAGLQAQIDAVHAPLMEKWASRSPSVQTMLAAEKLGNASLHPWLDLKALPPDVDKAAKAVRSMLDTIGTRAKELNIPIVEKGYVPHFMGRIFDNLNKSAPDVAAKARGLMHQLPNELRWQQRSAASRMWWPSVQELQHYIPDAHRKLAYTPVVQKWNGVLKALETKGFGDVSAYTRRYLDELAHGDQLGRFDKVTNLLLGAEYFGKVGFSPSTAFKHLWKATRLVAMNPISTAKTAPQLFNMVKGAAARRLGYEPGEAYRLTSQLLQARALFHGFTGIDSSKGMAGYMLGLVSGMPTAAVEAGERGLGILSTIHKGMALNMPFDKIQQQLYHTMLNVSFLGQVDKYQWLKTPLQQLFFLFYYTPMRITETTGKMGLYSVLPYRYLDEARKGFWTTLLKGPRRRDPFGTLYSTHLARNIAVVGAAAGIAGAYTGISPTKLAQIAMAHLPMMRESTRGTEIALPAVLDVPKQINEGGGLTMKSFYHALLQHYSIYTPTKIIRMLRGDIPKMYRGGPLPPQFYHAISEPPADTLHAMQRQSAQKNAPRVKRRFEMLKRQEQHNVVAMFIEWMKGLVK